MADNRWAGRDFELEELKLGILLVIVLQIHISWEIISRDQQN